MEVMINQVLTLWNSKVGQITDTFKTLGAGHALTQVAPGRNTVIYLLGHFIAVHDRIIEALELGERRYVGYDAVFLKPAVAGSVYPDYDVLLQQWVELNTGLSAQLALLTSADWLSRHHYVSEADFKLNPNRNKLNIILTRYGHLFHHGGQLVLIKDEKNEN